MADFDDSTLLRDFCASRDEAAFERLVRRHLGMVYGVAMRRLGSAVLAEEAAQNVFACLAAKARLVVRHPERLRAWLHRTAFLEAGNLARKEARQARRPAVWELQTSEPMERPEIFERLDAALHALPEMDREVLLRRYWNGEDFRSIGAAIGKSDDACQKRVERSLVKLAARLGGTGTVAGVTAAFTATRSTASAALPPSQRVAAGALERAGKTTGSAAGFLSGGLVAASLIALLLGAALGGQWEEAVSSANVSPVAQRQGLPFAKSQTLPPRPDKLRPAIEEVLASLDCGRIGPLLEFLPGATAAELRAIAEDRRTEEEFTWEPDAGRAQPAAMLVMQQWATLDPAAAFEWGRFVWWGYQSAGARALATWMKSDPAAALQAFASLTLHDRCILAEFTDVLDCEAGKVLIKAHPEVWRSVTEARYRKEWSELDPAKAETVAVAAVAGELNPVTDSRRAEVAFRTLAKIDPEVALVRAEAISQEPMRTAVLAAVRMQIAKTAIRSEEITRVTNPLPPGCERTALAGRYAEALVAEDPEALMKRVSTMPAGAERDSMISAAGAILARRDPWRLLELAVSLPGTVAGLPEAVPFRGNNALIAGSAGMAPWCFEYEVANALALAARDDPHRALAMLPELAAKLGQRETRRPMNGKLERMLTKVMTGWMARDAEGARGWAESTGSTRVLDMVKKRTQEKE
ncbi:MAG TPA: sigma-70 family RNA polymerase sigma factor [Verrucomicrobiales bacterium]|nr:sigma-70 family RNA polymerase sigma factor [Verrucomicrobiales bacterium]